MHELRRHRRMKVPLKLEIRHPATGTLNVATSDMSDGGVFALLDASLQPQQHESVLVRTLGLGPEGDETGPPLIMNVVRTSDDGIGLSLDEVASANLASWREEHALEHRILQSLFIYCEHKILLVMRQGKWRLPSRQLLFGEAWDCGLVELKNQLMQDAPLLRDSTITLQSQAVANSNTEPEALEFIVPCQLSPPTLNLGDSFQWIEQSKIANFSSCISTDLVDTLLLQV